jgi:hypothetical protein
MLKVNPSILRLMAGIVLQQNGTRIAFEPNSFTEFP